MPSVYGGNVPDVFHPTLGAIWTQELENAKPSWMGYLDEKSTKKRWFDDVEMADPGLWDETDEGNDLELDEYGEGLVTRYRPMKFSKRLIIPEEIFEDAAYEEAYDATRMLARTCIQTQSYDAVALLDGAGSFTQVDGVAMISTAHPIRGGAAVSNALGGATPLTPSNTAVKNMLVMCEKFVGTNGWISGVKLTKLFGPSDHKWRFKEILRSEQKDDTANNAINALRGELSSEYASVPEMSSTTNWFGKTNSMRGLMFIWRRKPRYRQTSNNENETTIYTGSARWTKGFSNFRGVIGSLI